MCQFGFNKNVSLNYSFFTVDIYNLGITCIKFILLIMFRKSKYLIASNSLRNYLII